MESFKVLGHFSWIVHVLLICGDVVSWMPQYIVSVKKMTLNKFVFVDNVNSWGKATYNFHKN